MGECYCYLEDKQIYLPKINFVLVSLKILDIADVMAKKKKKKKKKKKMHSAYPNELQLHKAYIYLIHLLLHSCKG